MLLQVVRLQRLLIGEQAIVILPELALLGRAVRRLAGLERLRVNLRQREVLPHDADLVAVRLLHLLERRRDALAERALEVRELDRASPARMRGPIDGSSAVTSIVVARRIEEHAHSGPALRKLRNQRLRAPRRAADRCR